MINIGFYPKIAWDGIRKNKRLYLPYILIGSVMVMMYYILSFLTESPALEQMKGGSVLMSILNIGCGVIAVFSVLFLFYTNSFLVKQRYREFGLYNILGMDKRNISRVMLWETLFTAVIVLAVGMVSGIALSKTAELVLLNMLNMAITFRFSIGFLSLRDTSLLFAMIYLLLAINSIIKVRISKPIELIRSSKTGEKTPKFSWLFGLIGVILLGIAYYLAVSIKEPVTALAWFFAAVILVIIGTYLIFISGSIAFCKLLQKNKRYYYKPNHFVSVSTMVYRMKRNGAGLASICILLTMVLVMISSTASLYFGAEDSFINNYPSSINIVLTFDNIDGISDDYLNKLRNDISEHTGDGVDLSGTRVCSIPGMFTDNGIMTDYTHVEHISYDSVGYLRAVSLEDYNRMMNESRSLASDECLIYSDRIATQWKEFTVEYGNTYKVKELLTEYGEDGYNRESAVPYVFIVVSDINTFAEPLSDIKNQNGDPISLDYSWRCGIDVAAEDEIAVKNGIYNAIRPNITGEGVLRYMSIESREEERERFFELYGSLFFLGIMLSIVFILAAVLIIYYKQISEGYEDQNRFEIMQKVGMTKSDIRKSINSQMLTVFFMPLIAAGIHLSFAYPFISKILLLFSFDNTLLNILATLICFAIFGLFYAIVYKFTSLLYYSIVSGKKEQTV